MVIKPLEEDSTPGTVKPFQVALVEPVAYQFQLEDNVLVIRRIHVILQLKALESQRETASRVHGFYADRCPIYRTLKPAISITTELVFEALIA